jgi:hypothetical protein
LEQKAKHFQIPAITHTHDFALMKILRLIFFLAAFGLPFSSCKKDNTLHQQYDYAYFPNDIGRYVVYDADSIVYDDFHHDTVYYKYQLKEVIESVFTDNEGRPSLRIERYYQFPKAIAPFYDNSSWVLKNVCYATRTLKDLERVENNTRFVNLIFPPHNLLSWNGNAQNTIGDWEYQYNGLDQPADFAAFHFDSTATVIQKDETNLLNRRFYRETYAKNVGLVSKQILDVFDTGIVFGVPVVNRIKGGVSYTLTVNSYGKQ